MSRLHVDVKAWLTCTLSEPAACSSGSVLAAHSRPALPALADCWGPVDKALVETAPAEAQAGGIEPVDAVLVAVLFLVANHTGVVEHRVATQLVDLAAGTAAALAAPAAGLATEQVVAGSHTFLLVEARFFLPVAVTTAVAVLERVSVAETSFGSTVPESKLASATGTAALLPAE